MPRRRKSLHRVTPYGGTYGLEGQPLKLHHMLSTYLQTPERRDG